MKDITGTVEITATVDTSSARQVGLDQDGIGMLMSILTNQYTNKHKAVLREYFCNGWDSHVDSGRTDQPVLVTLPSDMQPSLVIQDFGKGLAENEMLEIFGTYGKSTKRHDSTTTGGFGIGSKSAWTMGQQFVVTGVKDGVKTTALFALDAHGVGTCSIMSSQQTDEPNGVTISLAVPDVEAMIESAEEFFETVDRGTALVNGQEPTPVFETARQINDVTWVREGHKGEVYLVMGQVAYLVDSHVMKAVNKRLTDMTGEDNALAKNLAQWNLHSEGTSVYFKQPIDAVTVHPSRERLRDTAHTVNTLASLVLGLSQDLTDKVQSEIDAQPSLFQAALKADELVNALGAFQVSRKNLTYNGVKIRKTAKVDMVNYFTTNKSWRSTTKIVGSDQTRTLEPSQVERALVVTGVKEDEHGKVSRYLKRYLENTDRNVEWVFVTEQPWGAFDWFAFGTETGANTITLDEYKAELREMRETVVRTTNEPSYTVGWNENASRDLDERELLSDIVAWGKPVMVFHESSRTPSFAVKALEEQYTPVVLLPQQSLNALAKRLEEAGVEYFDVNSRKPVVEAAAREIFDSVTDDERAALGAQRWLSETYRARRVWENLASSLGRDKITSPVVNDILDTIDLATLVSSDISRERLNLLEEARRHLGEDKIEAGDFDFEIPSLREVLPLVSMVISDYSYNLRNCDAAKAEALALVNRVR